MKVKINSDALKKEIARTGRTIAEASQAIGYSAGALYRISSVGEMEERVVNLLESIGVKKSAYVFDERPRDMFYNCEDFTEEDKKLYKVVNKAVYDALSGVFKKYMGEKR